MEPERRPKVAKFLAKAIPVDMDDGWFETKKALRINDQYILIEDKWPDWTIADIIAFAKGKENMELIDLEVHVQPVRKESKNNGGRE